MKKIDGILVASLALGVWALVALTLLNSKPVGAQSGLSRSEVVGIIEDCTVSGSVSGEVYIYGMPYGEIESGRISGSIQC